MDKGTNNPKSDKIAKVLYIVLYMILYILSVNCQTSSLGTNLFKLTSPIFKQVNSNITPVLRTKTSEV
jgi:hypothetical protein